MYQIVFSDHALVSLNRMPANTASLIRKKIEHLAADPMRPNNNVKRLKGKNHTGYRLRLADWRILYRLEHDRLIVHVVKIGPRGSVYD